MLEIVTESKELFNEADSTFMQVPGVKLQLEHSLVSLSKWESIFEKPFLSDKEKTEEEVYTYIECMVLTPDTTSEVIRSLDSDNLEKINRYIESKKTATWFNEIPGASRSRETITSEIIYYWMVSHNIPLECENWHLARLITFIRVCNNKNAPPKKMPASAAAAQQRALNEQRKKQYGTTG